MISLIKFFHAELMLFTMKASSGPFSPAGGRESGAGASR
jgi:hypothetical protein